MRGKASRWWTKIFLYFFSNSFSFFIWYHLISLLSLYKCIRVAIESCGVGVKVDLVVSVTLFILPFIKRKGPNFDSLTSLLSSLRIPSALKSNLKILPTAWNDRTEFIFLGLLLNFLSYFFLLFSPRFHTDILVQRKCILLKREIENLNISFEMMKA